MGWVLLLAWLAACARDGPPSRGYFHNRLDYEAFREAHPEILEPNYLPFMLWRLGAAGHDGDWLAVCRWNRDAFPLPVHVAALEIPPEMQDEFRPIPPGEYAAATRRALAAWESELEGLVTFAPVESPERASLTLRLIGEEAPVPQPEVRVLGTTPLGEACRVLGIDEEEGRLRVGFEVPELRIYIADEFGLLNPDQVERIALHEIGHALGMRSHSPVPADLMFERVRDRPGASLSTQDVNSFVSLYRLPNGTIYRHLPAEGWAPPLPQPPPEGPPRLDLAPHVDARRGFEVQLPEGWMRVPTPTGVVAIDGVTWDYAASMQMIVRRYPTIDDYLARFASAHIRDGVVLEQGETVVAGHPAFRIRIASADGRLVDDVTVIEAGDGRVIVTIADCEPGQCEAYRPWFDATLATLEIWKQRGVGEAADREYRPAP